MQHMIIFDTSSECTVPNVMAVYLVDKLPSSCAIDRPNSNIMVVSPNKAYIRRSLTDIQNIKKLAALVQPKTIKIYFKDCVLGKDIERLFLSQGIDVHLISYSQTPA